MDIEIEDLVNIPIHRVVGGITKRALDIVAALFGLIILSPFFLILAILIKRDTRGPVFYRGPRIGLHGTRFKMLKFRTMYENAKSYQGPRVTCKEDDRITPLGRWLRDTKLNELPQLWNVLVGDMSLVGPRPEDPTISKTWPLSVARDLLSVRPGITSPASILYRDEESMLKAGEVMRKYLHELSPDKMRLDQLYVQYQSFWLDLDVILWTVFLLMPRIKNYSPPELFLFVGPITRLFQRYVNWFIWDLLVVLVSAGLVMATAAILGPARVSALALLGMLFGYCVLLSSTGLLMKTNQVKWPKATTREWGNLWATWFFVTALIVGVHHQLGVTDLRAYEAILLTALLSIAGFTIGRYRERLMSGLRSRAKARRKNQGAPLTRVLVIGSGRTAEHIAWLMDHPAYSSKFQVAGFIDDDLLSQGMKVYGSRVIGQMKDIPQLLRDRGIKLIVLADAQMAEQNCDLFQELASEGAVRVVMVPDIFGALAGLDCSGTPNGTGWNLNDFQWLVRRSKRQNRAWRSNTVASKVRSIAHRSQAPRDQE